MPADPLDSLLILTPRQAAACGMRLGPGRSVVPFRRVARRLGVTKRAAVDLVGRGLCRLDRAGVPTAGLRLRLYPDAPAPEARRCAA
jgi:hypothetical protein